MSEILLTTKTHIPGSISNLVKRPRLLEKLETGHTTASLTLVCAPAGSGKSTLLSQWISLNNHQSHATWVSLDQGDNDLNRFVAYLVASLQQIDGELGRTTQTLLEAPQSLSYETLLTPLLNELAVHDKQIILILDDYHRISELNIHDALDFLLANKPLLFHVVITTRHDPPFPLGRMRVQRQLNEIRAADLGFSREETSDYLRSVVGTALDTQEIQMLEERTEGWIAGLQLAGLALQGSRDPSEFVTRFAGNHTYLVDYLGEEVFNQQPEDIREFLLKTSMLTRLSPALCDAVTENNNGREILNTLRQSNLFLISLDDKRKWYRYHHLFSDLLLHFLQQESPEQVSELHHRASFWYESDGMVDDAIYHALQAQDYEHAADLIEQYGLAYINQHQLTVQRWISQLPQKVANQRSAISVFRARIGTANSESIAVVEQHVSNAERALSRMAESNYVNRVKAHIAFIRGYNARRHNDPNLALQCLAEAAHLIPQDDVIMQSILTLDLGAGYYITGRFAESLVSLQQVLTFPYQPSTKHIIIAAASDIAEIYLQYGKLRQCIQTCKEHIEVEHSQDAQLATPLLCYIYARLGMALYERNELDAAHEMLNKGLITGRQLLSNTATTASLTALTWLKLAQGYVDEVGILWGEVKAAYAQQGLFYGDFEFDYQQVRLWLALDNLDAASDWAFHYVQNQGERTNWNIRLDMMLARVRIEEKALNEALTILEDALAGAEANGLMGWVIQGLIIQAIAYDKKRRKDHALQSLAKALSIAEPEGYIRTFVDEGAALAELLSDLIANYRDYSDQFAFSAGYVSDLLRIIDEESLASPLSEPLTERELDVLRLLAAGFSNQDIADKLFITLGTVKQYNHIIYRKLDVRTRNQAVDRAKDLNLL